MGSTSRPPDETGSGESDETAGGDRDSGDLEGDESADSAGEAVAGADDRGADQQGRTVELFLRSSSAARGTQDLTINALQRLRDRDRLESVDVTLWPGRVSLAQHGRVSTEVVRTFERFDAWARANDASVCPPFVRTTHESAITGERDELLLTPMAVLAVYDGDDLVGVYPRRDEEGVVTVADWLGQHDAVDGSRVRGIGTGTGAGTRAGGGGGGTEDDDPGERDAGMPRQDPRRAGPTGGRRR